MGPAEFAACECSAHYRREQGEPNAPHTPGCPADGLEWPLTFTLTIELGNEGMQTQADARRALRAVGKRLDYYGDTASILAAGQGDPIRDVNGNTVGSWGVK